MIFGNYVIRKRLAVVMKIEPLGTGIDWGNDAEVSAFFGQFFELGWEEDKSIDELLNHKGEILTKIHPGIGHGDKVLDIFRRTTRNAAFVEDQAYKLVFNLKNDNLFWKFMTHQFPVAHSRLLDIEEKRKQWTSK
ncbi:887_t:CDS:2 [Gigaspora rosea]|nr:887_t:CDS:2 [Gigaspora rosea]